VGGGDIIVLSVATPGVSIRRSAMQRGRYLCLLVLGLLVCVVFGGIAEGTALDDYVAAPDANYSYTHVATDSYFFTECYILDMNSLGWRDLSEVDQVVWRHWVTVVVPKLDWLLGPTKDTALILVGDGNSFDPMPAIDPNFRDLATGTRSVIVELSAVPNQPLQFSDEPNSRIEDEIIAYSWDKFLRGGDANWPVQLPMVKAVVRCMDAVQNFVYSETGKTINYFVLTGGSKRGWTAWLTAAVDLRVTAVAPIVSDLLNMRRSFAHHWSCYGSWVDALEPYEELGIFDWFDSAEATELVEIVDAYEYRDRLDIPKFIINTAGDDFFVPDSIQFYIDGLLGETYLRHVPNTDHYLTGAFGDVFECTVPYYDAFLNGDARPQFSWSLEDDGSIRVETVGVPKAVSLWAASNETARDFRLITIGTKWVSTPLVDQGGGVYIGEVNEPVSGWTAFFVELVYESPFQGADAYDYHFTTEMRVLPEMRSYEGDFDRDTITDALDLAVLGDVWLTENVYRDVYPRRSGDGTINFGDFDIFGLHWLEGY
jgi:PhoPQ-activated pathogenicity-related protein